jgi:hypothetical protein
VLCAALRTWVRSKPSSATSLFPLIMATAH